MTFNLKIEESDFSEEQVEVFSKYGFQFQETHRGSDGSTWYKVVNSPFEFYAEVATNINTLEELIAIARVLDSSMSLIVYEQDGKPEILCTRE